MMLSKFPVGECVLVGMRYAKRILSEALIAVRSRNVGKKKPPPLAAAAERLEQIERIRDCVEEVTYYHYNCCICEGADEDNLYGLPEDELVAALYKRGWRYSTSKKFRLAGLMCPKCHKTPDANRKGADL
jgi:hypothetical protein